MVYKNSLFLATLISIGTLTGCGSTEISSYEDMLNCGLAASQLDQNQAAAAIERHFREQSEENPAYGPDMYKGLYFDMIREDLHEKYADQTMSGLKGELFYPIKTYNSKVCMNMHEQEKIDLFSEDFPIMIPLMYYGFYVFI